MIGVYGVSAQNVWELAAVFPRRALLMESQCGVTQDLPSSSGCRGPFNHRTGIQALNTGVSDVSDRFHSVCRDGCGQPLRAEDGSRIYAGCTPKRQ